MDFAERLKELRKEHHLTQKELAKGLGLTANCICEWENRRCEPNISSLLKMSIIFGESVSYLIGQEDDFGHVTVQDPIPAPTAEERELLALFGKMTSAQKIRFMAYGEGLIGAPLTQRKA